jgi:hypothetical protein
MTTVVCSTSMASAFNVVLNLVCIWLSLIVMADLRKIRNGGKGNIFDVGEPKSKGRKS